MFYDYIKRLTAYTAYRGAKFLKRTPAPLKHFATETLVHEPASKGSYPPPVTLDGQIERATGNYWGPLDQAIKYATQTDQSHRATILYKLDKIIVDNGFLYKSTKAEYLSSLGIPKLKKLSHAEDGVLCSTSSGAIYFGDWMFTDNLLEGIANELCVAPIKVAPHINYKHLSDINKLLNLSRQYSKEPTKFDTLLIPEDIGYNRNKTKRLQNLRDNFSGRGQGIRKSGKFIYIMRGTTSDTRLLSNETEIIEYLQSVGFKTINPSQMSVSEIKQTINGSDIVIGIEGSQLCYGLLGLKEGGLMMTLQPPYHFQSSWRPRCESVGVRWGFLVGIENNTGFEVPLDDVKRLLDKVM